jgi:uncharacterized membrane protein YidH (DUF202 family)
MTAPARAPSSNELATERTELALTRTSMALERTLMAWLRTSIALISFGFTIFKFIPAVVDQITRGATVQSLRNVGLLMVVLGVVLLFLGLLEYKFAKRKLFAGSDRHTPISMAALASTCVFLLGIFAIADMFMEETFARIFDNLLKRTSGPLHFRVYMQPVMATVFAVIDGIADIRAGKPPYFWALFTREGYRMQMIREGWRSIGKIIIVAILLDVGYQIFVESFVYPLETVIVAFVLAIGPYVIVRGVLNRVATIASFINRERSKGTVTK